MTFIIVLLVAFFLLTVVLGKNTRDFHRDIEQMGLGEAYNHLVQTPTQG